MIGAVDERRVAELERILAEQADTLDDPLAIHDQLCQLLLPAPTLLLPALERATRSLLPDPRYTNDPRHLRLWLSYAKHVRQPVDVFAFLAERGVGRALAAFYEEWAWCVRRQGGGGEEVERILRLGVEREAQPLERLRRTCLELTAGVGAVPTTGRPSWSMAGQSANLSWTQSNATDHKPAAGKIEVSRYDKELIAYGKLSFEEARARVYLSKPPPNTSITTTTNTTTQFDSQDDDIEDLAQPVNPEDLTHISVYKDTTLEAREMARMLKSAVVVAPSVVAPSQPNVMMLQEGLARSFPIPENIRRVKGNVPVMIVNRGERTVAPVTIGAKKYYVERQLGTRTYLAVDLNCDPDKDAHVVLKRVEHRELAIWSRCPQAILPSIIDAVVFGDAAVLVVKYYELSNVKRLLQAYDQKHQPMDNRIVLFYTRHILATLCQLLECKWIANGITMEGLLIGSSPDTLDTVYHADGRGGWSSRGLVLSGLPSALPADHHYITPLADNPVGHVQLDWLPCQSTLLHLLHSHDPAQLSPQWQQLFLVLSNPLGDADSLRACIAQIDAILQAATNPTLKALIVRQEMMLMCQY